jgi:hypothetical protein
VARGEDDVEGVAEEEDPRSQEKHNPPVLYGRLQIKVIDYRSLLNSRIPPLSTYVPADEEASHVRSPEPANVRDPVPDSLPTNSHVSSFPDMQVGERLEPTMMTPAWFGAMSMELTRKPPNPAPIIPTDRLRKSTAMTRLHPEYAVAISASAVPH